MRGHIFGQAVTVIAIVTRIAFAPVASRQSDVGHFARGNEMHCFPPVSSSLDHFQQELLRRRTEQNLGIARIHTMRIQFNEHPVGAALNGNARTLPQLQATQRRRIGGRQCSVFNAAVTVARSLVEIKRPGPLHDKRQGGNRPANA